MGVTGQPDKKKFAFPSALTILTAVLVLVWIATFFIPAGQYELDAGGSPIAGTYRQIEAPHDFAGQV